MKPKSYRKQVPENNCSNCRYSRTISYQVSGRIAFFCVKDETGSKSHYDDVDEYGICNEYQNKEVEMLESRLREIELYDNRKWKCPNCYTLYEVAESDLKGKSLIVLSCNVCHGMFQITLKKETPDGEREEASGIQARASSNT